MCYHCSGFWSTVKMFLSQIPFVGWIIQYPLMVSVIINKTTTHPLTSYDAPSLWFPKHSELTVRDLRKILCFLFCFGMLFLFQVLEQLVRGSRWKICVSIFSSSSSPQQSLSRITKQLLLTFFLLIDTECFLRLFTVFIQIV